MQRHFKLFARSTVRASSRLRIVVIEGEEETESHLEALRQSPTLICSQRTSRHRRRRERRGRRPHLEVTTRGGVMLDVEVRTLERPVHSGIFGGGAPDAVMAIARMLANGRSPYRPWC